MVAYGKRSSILPQIVAKLAQPDNVFAVQLYNELQCDDLKASSKELDCPYILDNLAALAFEKYWEFVQRFNDVPDQWTKHQATASSSSSSSDYLNHNSFHELVRLSHAAVPFIMERYADDRNGWWYKLLIEIVDGQNSDAETSPSCERTTYNEWRKYYEGDLS